MILRIESPAPAVAMETKCPLVAIFFVRFVMPNGPMATKFQN